MSDEKIILQAVPGKGYKADCIEPEKYAIKYYDEVVIPDGITNIDRDAFRNQAKLTKVTLPDSLWAIGSGAFAGCFGNRDDLQKDPIRFDGLSAERDNNQVLSDEDNDCQFTFPNSLLHNATADCDLPWKTDRKN